MEQPQSANIRYTVKCCISALGTISPGHLVHNYSQNKSPLDFRPTDLEVGSQPIVEIVTVVDAVNPGALNESTRISLDTLENFNVINTRGTHMIVHSETLSQIIRDVVQFYPGQNLMGTSLVIYEPYSCLIHHMSDLEELIDPEGDNTRSEHLQVLLEFLRPRFQQQYSPARERSLAVQPTVKFDDLWVIMKPGSLAYAKWDGISIGCVVGKSVHLTPKPSDDLPERWSIKFWFLQVHWPSDQIGCAIHTAVINRFDGEKLITSLPLCPAEFHDLQDQGAMKRHFTDRGEKVCEVLWGESKYMYYDGECMDQSKQRFTGPIIVGGSDGIADLYPKHHWNFGWVPPSEIMKKDSSVPLSEIEHMVNPKTNPRDILTIDQLFIISPCLSAFTLTSNAWMPITVGNIRPISIPHHTPDPFIAKNKLRTIYGLVDSQGRSNTLRPSDSLGSKGNGVIILLHGAPGVGKSYTVESISMRTGRPLLTLTVKDLSTDQDKFQNDLARWFSLAEKWDAILVIDSCDVFIQRRGMEHSQQTTGKVGLIDEQVYSRVSLMVLMHGLDNEARYKIFESRLHQEENIRLSPSATRFLRSSEAHVVNWNGHEVKHYFKTALALATAEGNQNAHEVIIVEDYHFKEAMNMAYEARQYMNSTIGGYQEDHARSMRWRDDSFVPSGTPLRFTETTPGDTLSIYDSSEGDEPGIGGYIGVRPSSHVPQKTTRARSGARSRSRGRARSKGSQQPMTLDSDAGLCVPDLNCVDWDAFQSVGRTELFRKTKFHAIDVLEGEPLIKFHVDNKGRRKHKILAENNAASHHKHARSILEPGEAPLPDRIRINSPAIIKAFAEIHGESFSGPFLLFRPFRSLLYYEQEFREWVARQEKILQGSTLSIFSKRILLTSNIFTDGSAKSSKPRTDGNDADNETESIIGSEGLEEMRCLLSFIRNKIKKKQEYLASSRYQTLSFADISLLFNPGDAVVAKDQKQAYRVIKVNSMRHRAKNRDETRQDFWKDESKAEFKDNPVFVHCTYVDFDGNTLGPVTRIFTISRFHGQCEVASLPIYPIRFIKEDDFRKKLIERGKSFFNVASIKHMHYKGLSLRTREEIDSQVVIDFDEAITRYPDWQPSIKSAIDESFNKSVGWEDEPGDDADRRKFLREHRSVNLPCIKECCASEVTHHDEYVEDRKREEYIASQMKEETATRPSVTIIPRDFRDVVENNTLTDDEFLIMSYRVFGFVLRSRKWHELDMANIFEVAPLGTGEGFDQLVLPPGHGDMVKSMIKQHLRDKKLSSMDRGKTDVVHGKGRGLIMLLHGVPGVGKTSTAECVADSFRRPLFQITSGDLGTTAREVEDALEENFSLASRWNSILLIDEADVFLAERMKEDFVRNSLVAVFLRMMEYYAGVLFLTTNRVGVFDEAFTSRIHISLYYPPLERQSTLQIFEKNWDRIKTRYEQNERKIDIKILEITEFALDYFDNNKEGRWNGRTDDLLDESDHNRPVVLGKKNFETVATAYKGFTSYLKQVYGADFARRARENLWRFDAFGIPKIPNALNTRLRVAEPALPASEPWVGQSHSGYNPRNAQPHYPPQHHYPERYDHPDPRPRYTPPSGQYQHRDPHNK
ncbi:hypothetical protein HD806DRAFT_533827 [Xylariaceae sp. AK1471]|nr:hypothetical protein HD806DRAFT_533827 [Xylariaceae sp. AK1471]